MPRVLIAPSILAADLAHLADEVTAVEEAGADLIHVDVMDGHFVPQVSFGPLLVAAVRRSTSLPIDVHLMITAPESTIARYVDAGASGITVHAEATPHPHRALQAVREAGLTAGLAVNPLTPLAVFDDAWDVVDLALVMSVNPGFGGQAFLSGSLRRLAALRAARDAARATCRIQVDGGIGTTTARAVVEAGADVLVAGSAVFDGTDPGARLRALRAAAGRDDVRLQR
jgi:ribulose-phosphate 3-epimerase